jgi:DNA-binding transcriptional regulator YiaG
LRQTSKQVVAEIDTLLDDHTEAEIASILNDKGHVSGEGKRFHAGIVRRLRRDYEMKTRYDRLRDTGMLTLAEMADLLGVSTSTVKNWRNHGLLRAHAYTDKNECLYEHPGDDPPVKAQGRKLSKRFRLANVESNRSKEVQCEA